jgi:hypothetical protein
MCKLLLELSGGNMQAVHVRSQIGEDGTIELKVPTGLQAGEVDVTLILRPVIRNSEPTEQELEDSRRFVAQTAGAWKGEPLERSPQGEYEKREQWG